MAVRAAQLILVVFLGVFGGWWLSQPASAPVVETHVVRAGETLSGIALAHGTTAADLVALNRERYPDLAEANGRLIRVGWELALPSDEGEPRWQALLRDLLAKLAARALDRVRQWGIVVEGRGGTDSPREPVLRSTPTPGIGEWDLDAGLEIVRLVNVERANVGLSTLTIDERLMGIARKRAAELSLDFSHAGLDDDCATCGENAGWRFSSRFSPQAQVAGWMASTSGHRENLLDGYAARVGVGVYRAPNGKVYSAYLFER